jgi:hypothetical protein
MAGMLLRGSLPRDHTSSDSKETVKLGMGLVSTMSALVLGLLVSSAKSFYDTQSAELNQLSADVVAVDRLLTHYGPETKDARDMLYRCVVTNWNECGPRKAHDWKHQRHLHPHIIGERHWMGRYGANPIMLVLNNDGYMVERALERSD